jgi:hypothetical protein
MNKYHIEVMGSQWPIKEVIAEEFKINNGCYHFLIYQKESLNYREIAIYPIDKTIISDIEYHIDL